MPAIPLDTTPDPMQWRTKKQCTFTFDDLTFSDKCQFVMDLEHCWIELNTHLIDPLRAQATKSISVAASNVKDPIACLLLKCSGSLFSTKDHVASTFIRLTPRSGRFTESSSNEILNAHAPIANFPVKSGQPAKASFNGWSLSLDCVIAPSPDQATKAFCITHWLTVTRLNDMTFTPEDLAQQLDLLALFLSFCAGQYVAPAFVEGFDRSGQCVYTEWGTRRLSRIGKMDGWFDAYSMSEFPKAYKHFASLASTPEWADVLHSSIYWNCRAETYLAGPDGGLILVQTALERIAWQYLVLDSATKCRSKGEFKIGPASKHIDSLLEKLSIPLSIHPDLKDLLAFAGTVQPLMSAATAIGKIRNDMVHPERLIPGKHLPIYDSFKTAKWMLEVVLLALMGYMGLYSDRRKEERYVGDSEPVPWMPAP